MSQKYSRPHGSSRFSKRVAVAGHVHRHDAHLRRAGKRGRRNVQIVELRLVAFLIENLADDFAGEPGGLVEAGVLVELERDGHAGDAEERPFDGRRHRARVKHVDPGVQSAVDAADDQIGRARAELEDADLDAIGGASLDGPTPAAFAFGPAFVAEDLLDDQRRQIGDRVAHAALFGGRGHDHHVAQGAHFPFESRQAGGVNSIVVRQKYQHGFIISTPLGRRQWCGSLDDRAKRPYR